MIDVLSALLDFLLDIGTASPNTLHGQRRARLTVAVVVFAFVAGARIWIDNETVATFILVGSSVAAVWVFVFSIVDVVKERPSTAWLSVASIAIAALTLLIAAWSP